MLSKKSLCKRLSTMLLSTSMVFGGLTAVNAAYAIGDVDLTGSLTANDAACVLSYVLMGEKTGYTSEQIELADVNGDGLIAADDAATILQHVLDSTPINNADTTGETTTVATTVATTQATTETTTETTTVVTTVATTQATTETTTETTTEATTESTTVATTVATTTETTTETTTATTTETTTETTTVSDTQSYLEKHGQLRLDGTQLVDKNGDAIVLNGMSTHGIAWFPDFTKTYSIAKTKEAGANVFRVAMYTEEYNGYTTGTDAKAYSKQLAYDAVDAAIAQDMYVIIDWHILNDYNPQTHKSEAIDFFNEFSAKYANNPAIIYEICNEPHWVSWSSDIKPYAEEVIPVIRANSPNAVVIVGTNTWSQDVDEASRDLLNFDNVMYTLHFYAGTHYLSSFKSKIETALANGAPIFVTEWGSTDSSGNGNVATDSTREWLDYLAEKKISWCNWSLSNKDETSAALKSSANAYSWTESDLTDSGKITFEYLNKNK